MRITFAADGDAAVPDPEFASRREHSPARAMTFGETIAFETRGNRPFQTPGGPAGHTHAVSASMRKGRGPREAQLFLEQGVAGFRPTGRIVDGDEPPFWRGRRGPGSRPKKLEIFGRRREDRALLIEARKAFILAVSFCSSAAVSGGRRVLTSTTRHMAHALRSSAASGRWCRSWVA